MTRLIIIFLSVAAVTTTNSSGEIQTGDGQQSDSPDDQNVRRVNLRPNQQHALTLNIRPQQNNRPNLNLHSHQLHAINFAHLLHLQHNRPTSLANILSQYNHLVSQHHLATLNHHRNPHFYHHTHAKPGQGSHQLSPPTTPSPTIPPVERPRGLARFKRQYKKWWNAFHADLTSCGTQYGVNDGVNSVFRVIGGRISSIKSWPWMVGYHIVLITGIYYSHSFKH